MLELIVAGIVPCLVGAIHALILATFLSPTLGDFWPVFQKAFLINGFFYTIGHLIQQYLKRDLE